MVLWRARNVEITLEIARVNRSDSSFARSFISVFVWKLLCWRSKRWWADDEWKTWKKKKMPTSRVLINGKERRGQGKKGREEGKREKFFWCSIAGGRRRRGVGVAAAGNAWKIRGEKIRQVVSPVVVSSKKLNGESFTSFKESKIFLKSYLMTSSHLASLLIYFFILFTMSWDASDL